VRGVGCAAIGNADAGEDNNECVIRLAPNFAGNDARIFLDMDVTESGMGQRSNLCKMAAEILNVPYEAVEITPPGTGLANPTSFGLCGSRGTITYGRAVCMAAEDIRQQLFHLAEAILHVPTDTMELINNGVRCKYRPDKFVPWKALLPHHLSCIGKGKHLECFGIPSCCVVFLDVEVDTETGKTKILHFTSGADVGQVIDPAALEMQLQAGIGAASMDSATYEENIIDYATGRTMTYNMIEYKWRPFNEFPTFSSKILESQLDSFHFKAVGIAEVTGAAMAPAVMQAISNAVGVKVAEYPATPAVVLKALGKL
jgi:CO/xanthine dehydrogenase Mo-binding subunit